ncbi:alpha-L-fucosidase [Sphingobacterium sp. SRCM116780]|uniref:alpha-L-fucosidase n=1 Tax=Sphingobacterium sp. SRCM116780 TaxID=2907623 RepID=UPI001F21FB29|nr:alpha-L-fucosidase [Sphingobacterium sp. SRCM116780]UIR56189.1 alpha-L-fucosidase [Sphingobacterium sp. SRCM116780]
MLTFLLSSLFLVNSGVLPAKKVDPPKPYGAVPSERQLKWHEMDTYCLIHFTPTTFQNKEWGYGDANPEIFNPSNFDANQIARAAASAGFKGLISVTKHHDGFCLWPTATTTYSVASSPWKNGKGDMVKEFMTAAHSNNMKFGVYLSAWDRNDTRYGTAAYADAYRAQLTELMSNYGELFTSWHDGANGGDGYYGGLREKRTIDRSTYYAWEDKTWPIVRKLQPMAMIFSDIGPDMRWVGNEKGFAGETSWATFTPEGVDGQKPVPGHMNDKTLTSGVRNGKYWIPAECDVPQRPGWFYHSEQDAQVKTPNQLFEIYLKSVGRGANMNLGLAPMPSGQLHENDVKSLEGFGKKVKKTFETNLAKGAQIKASSIRGHATKVYGTQYILDNDRYSYWATNDQEHQATLDITLKGKQTFDIIQIRENIKLGQRLDSVVIEQKVDGAWVFLAKATSIGANRLLKLDKPVTIQQLRLHLFAPVAITVSDFGLYKEYNEPFAFTASGLNKLSSDQFIVETSPELIKAHDENGQTFAALSADSDGFTFELKKEISGFGYLPRQDGKIEGTATKYKIYTSQDKQKWELLKEGEFSNIKANPILQQVMFDSSVQAKYIKFVPTETLTKNLFTIAEFELYSK